MAYETYGQINGVIREIQRGDSCCSQILRLDTENGEVRFTVMADTMVIENVRLRRGMRVAAFYDTSLPVPAILSSSIPGRDCDSASGRTECDAEFL